MQRQESISHADIRKKYGTGKLRPNKDVKRDLEALRKHLTTELDLMVKLEKELVDYAKNNLNKIAGNNYTVDEIDVGSSGKNSASSKKSTKPERATAVSNLLEMLKKASAYEVYQYVTTPHFQEIIGAKEWNLNAFRQHLNPIINQFIEGYAQFLECTNNDVLLDVLLNEKTCSDIKDRELAQFLLTYNPKLLADFIVNVYKIEGFKVDRMDFNFLKGLLANDATALKRINVERKVCTTGFTC